MKEHRVTVDSLTNLRAHTNLLAYIWDVIQQGKEDAVLADIRSGMSFYEVAHKYLKSGSSPADQPQISSKSQTSSAIDTLPSNVDTVRLRNPNPARGSEELHTPSQEFTQDVPARKSHKFIQHVCCPVDEVGHGLSIW